MGSSGFSVIADFDSAIVQRQCRECRVRIVFRVDCERRWVGCDGSTHEPERLRAHQDLLCDRLAPDVRAWLRYLFQRFGTLRVIGEIFGGFVLGSSVLGLFLPGIYAGLFRAFRRKGK